MSDRIHPAHAETVLCANKSCGRGFHAVPLVPTLSKDEELGHVWCPHCGERMEADASFLWVGIASEIDNANAP